ncbi:DNA recombination protein RmuC, partial [Leucobacter sp. M11]|uniref:DNA recombination protein RmuC n=1 Tax=Leucobacter sp. M11 TaxID=2993565 RepID=UPI002D7EBC62
MDVSWLFPVAVLAAAALAFALGWLGARALWRGRERDAAARGSAETELAGQRARLDAEQGARVLREELAAAESRIFALEERLADAIAQRDQHHARERDEQRVLQQLAPVRETLGRLAETVTELETQRANQHGELQQQLRVAAAAEERLRGTADSLAAALRNNNARGAWGETQLRRLVEAAGMVERVDFTVQDTLRGPDATARPDMIVRLPGNKQLAIDAKAPMSAFLDAG